uniref:succinate dehydrogenase subunit 4 n=1 Tax=Fushitsunagia catenata TaxID=1827018 RepID=UPI0026E26545|nr:succinate dehydrogenase subunit 4 [Fushitsunagia catenata]WJJ67931.1 succinate dehydrogenase subunit 4 [Fushitsunagia catenata]
MFNSSWLVFRTTALLILVGFIIDIEINFAIIGFLLFHANLGLTAIFSDYIHIKKLKVILLVLVRVSIIELTSYILGFLL